MSIRLKLIAVSTVLLIVVIGLFGIVNSMQSKRIIDDFSQMLRNKITQSLRQSGESQLALLSEVAQLALEQSDYSTLQATVHRVAQQELVNAAVVVNPRGMALASNNPGEVGKPARGVFANRVGSGTKVMPEVTIGGRKSIAFATQVRLNKAHLCTVFLAYNLEPLARELVNASRKKSKEVAASIRTTLLVGLLAVLFGVLMTILLSISLSRPIQALARQADRMANGDLEARVDIRSRDEIGFLGKRFNYMAQQITVLVRETLAKATMEKELEVASAIQSTLVPDDSVAHLDGMTIAGFFRPATHCGGDWWSYYRLPEGRTLVLVGDVTGHGVGAAMITAAAQGAVTTLVGGSEEAVELASLLGAMNNAIHAAARGKFVMTCFAAVFDPRTRTLDYANAGHNFPYYYRLNSGELNNLVVRGNRLGDLAGSNYQVDRISVEQGDMVFWYTDGVVECENIRGEEYGDRRFRAEIQRHAILPPEQALDRIINKADTFFGEAPQKDDITVVVSKFT